MQTIDASGKRVYGKWAGNEKGCSENETRCIEEVFPEHSIFQTHQCQRKRGYGDGGLYCKQHAKQHPEDKKEEKVK